MSDTMMGPGSTQMPQGNTSPDPDQDEAQEPMEEQDEGNDSDQADIFLSKANLGGRTVKPGDHLSLTVSDVDPETGDVQATLDKGDGGTSGSGGGNYASDFDKAMPEEG